MKLKIKLNQITYYIILLPKSEAKQSQNQKKKYKWFIEF